MIAVRLLRRPDGVEPGTGAVQLGTGGAIIGRSPECDVVLEDPVRLVSRQQAQLLPLGADAAVLRCVSASVPISVNTETLAPGGERRVYAGDRLRIGGFELQIETGDGTSVAMVPGAGGPVAEVPAAVIRPPIVTLLDEVLNKAPAPVALGPAPPEPTPVAAAPVAPVPAAWRRTPAPVAGPVVPPASAALPARSRLDQWFDLDDAVADPLAPDSPLPAVGQAIGAPTAEDRPAVLAPPAPRSDAPREHPAGASAAPVAASVVVAVTDPPQPQTPDAPVTPQPGAVGDEALMRAFLQGAGVAIGEAGPAWTLSAAWMQHLGRLLRAATDGTLALLRSRAVVKRSIRAEGTRIVLRENNPLKFAPDAAEALAMLLGKQGAPGFLEPVDAMRDAHNDLLVHQLAMVAGMRAAVLELISRLGPDVVEAQQGPPKGLSRRVPLLHEAALWRRHRQQHAHLIANLDDDFEAVFGREFLLAYEAQSRLAAAQRPAPAERG